jgi:hypothetical protein
MLGFLRNHFASFSDWRESGRRQPRPIGSADIRYFARRPVASAIPLTSPLAARK